jgi:hypothetical protein
MWIMSERGFYSISEGDPTFPDSNGMMQVRVRDREDLDRLREVIPGLGPTIRRPSATTSTAPS